MYKVIKFFTDLQDKNHAYHVGDEFPRKGHDVKIERLTELSGSNNKQGVPLIEYVQENTSEAQPDGLEEEIEEPKEEKPKKRGKRDVGADS